MNISPEMMPGICLLAAGAVLGFGAPSLTRKKDNVNSVKLLGVLLAAVGAVLVFLA